MTSPARLLELVERFPGTTVLLVGDLVLDRFVLGTPKAHLPRGTSDHPAPEAQRDVPGGAANALANLAALDVRALPVGVVGDDEPGGALLDALAERASTLRPSSGSPATRRRPRSASWRRAGLAEAPGGALRHRGRLPAGGPWLGQLLDQIDRLLPEAQAVALSDYGYGTVADEALQRLVAGGRRPRWTCADSRSRIAELAGVDGVTRTSRSSRPPPAAPWKATRRSPRPPRRCAAGWGRASCSRPAATGA